MKKIILLSLFLINSVLLFSQKHCADKWLFGIHAGLDFSSGNPVVIPADSMYTPEGCSMMSDTLGNLLFYSNGVTVWDKNNTPMPNGQNLMGDWSSTQAALIIPHPTNNNLYYLFTSDADAGADGCRLSIVDLSLRSGLGDVTLKDSLLLAPVSEKITAVKDPYANRYWVVIHAWGSNAFYAYEINSAGLQPAVVSNVGTSHSGAVQNSFGQMKFNGCGNKLALAAGYLNKVEIFDFNMSNGVISNPLTINFSYHVYGLEFSADATRLYVSNYNPLATLVQYDITSGNATTISNSAVILSTTTDIYGLQLGNDGKIYVCKSYSQYLGVVNSPNTLGTACNYNDNGIDLDPGFNGYTSALSLPGFITSYFKDKLVTCPASTGIKASENSRIAVVYPNPFSHTATLVIPEGFSSHGALVKITDISGKVVREIRNISTSEISFTAENLQKGMYFFTILNSEKERASGKFIIQ